MDLFAIIAIVWLPISAAVIFFRPEAIIGVQLFATPIFGHGLASLGVGFGSVNTILALVAFSLAVSFFRDRKTRFLPTSPMEIGVMLFIFWVATTLLYTPSPSYGSSKLIFFLSITFPCMFMARLHCDTPEKLRRAFTSTGWYGFFLLLYYLTYIVLNNEDQARARSEFFGPLSLGYIAVAITPFVFFNAVHSKQAVLRLIAAAAIPSAVIVVVATGSRGPVLALLCAVVISFLRIKYFARVLAGFVIAIAAGIYYISAATEAGNLGLERILGKTEAADASTEAREKLFALAIEQFNQFPLFGQGIGSFSHFVHSADHRYYAHNSYLEIAGELGLIGLVLFFAVLTYCIVRIQIIRNRSDNQFIDYYWAIAAIQLVFFIGIVNSNVSFALPAQRVLFVGIGLIAATTYWKSRRSSKSRHSNRRIKRHRSREVGF